MEFVAPEQREEVLRPLLPSEPEPGTQAGFHFLQQKRVGEAFVTRERTAAVVVREKNAWVFGSPSEEIGRFLIQRGFFGTVAGAWSSNDPSQALTDFESPRVSRRVVLLSDSLSLGLPDSGTPELPRGMNPARISLEHKEALERCRGREVFQLWEEPAEAELGWVITKGRQIVATGGPRTLSDKYAEVAVWIQEDLAGKGLLAVASPLLLAEVLESGRKITSVIRTNHQAALRLAEKVGWRPVSEETVVSVGDMRSARAAQRRLGLLDD